MPETIGSIVLSAIAVEGTAAVVTIGSYTITAAQVATAVATVAITAGSAAIQASAARGSSADAGTAQTQFRQAIPARRRFYGKNRVSGPLMFLEVADGVQYNLMALADGPINAINNLWLNDDIVTLDGNNGVTTPPYAGIAEPFSPIIFIWTQLGADDQAALSKLTTDFPTIWTSDHRLRGVATMLVTAGSVPPASYLSVYPGGMVKGQIEGTFAKVYDPRLDSTAGGSGAHRISTPSTWAYSANSVLVLLDYLKHADGHAIPTTYFDGVLSDWGVQATICDDAITQLAGGTAPRYETHGGYSFDEPRKQVLARILDSFDGWLYLRTDGKIGVRAGKLYAPTVTLTDDDILGYELESGADALSAANTIRATYISAASDYQKVDVTPWVDAADVAIRGTKETLLPLDMVQNFSQARRLMKRAANRANPRWVLTLVTKITGFQVFGERFVTINSAELGINATFENLGASLETANMTCTLRLRHVPSTLDDWVASEEETTAPPVPGDPPASSGPVPTGLAASVITNVNGSFLRISCTAPANTALQFMPEYQRAGDASWTAINVAAGVWTVDTAALPLGTYSVRARFGLNGVLYPYATALTGIAIAAGTPPPPTDFTAVATVSAAPGTVTLTALAPNSNDHAALRFWRNTTNTFAGATDVFGALFSSPNVIVTQRNTGLAAGTYYYWVTSENEPSLRSTAVSAPAVTIT